MAKKRIRKPHDPDLFADAVNYRTAYGAQWPDLALAHLKRLSTDVDRVTFDRWVELMKVMMQLDEPKH
ncbi:hypothetical protein [Sphingomonas xinjiangensis]|uniref:Uncharacterized protein n=1 Tax=Sphingomonas xinjiangensis TaxID=643568 RepID=A0A840YTT7_9SPHN|nr:hypothetical protein [Sphingomonas xinjiangensis]MBB5713047.1 hypothetical protein [Sphingomonas xinjiangensis]